LAVRVEISDVLEFSDLVGLEIEHLELLQICDVVDVCDLIVRAVELPQIIEGDDTREIAQLTPRDLKHLNISESSPEISDRADD